MTSQQRTEAAYELIGKITYLAGCRIDPDGDRRWQPPGTPAERLERIRELVDEYKRTFRWPPPADLERGGE